MEHPTDASPADDAQPTAKTRRLWDAPKLTVMPLARATQASGNVTQEGDNNTKDGSS
jgi:hypothetical protein